MADCICTKAEWLETWDGHNMVLCSQVVKKDRRCPRHGKPRWPKERHG